MLQVKPFAAGSWLGLIAQHGNRFDTYSNGHWIDLNRITCLMIDDMDRFNHPAYHDDYMTAWRLLGEGKMHEAMGYASDEMIEAVVRVATSRGDVRAKLILDENY